MITISGLNKSYNGFMALNGIDLHIDQTGLFGLLGINGAGKTTLMRILAGLLTPDSGEVQVFGNDMTSRTGRRATKELLGYLPQHIGVYPNLTGWEFLDYVAILKGITDREQRQREVDLNLERVRLYQDRNRQVGDFSGGMKQRIGIAQALLGQPRLLIVDEPTVGLDPEERIRVRNLLSEMADSTLVILSTHIVEDIGASCSDLAVLFKGEIVYRGRPQALIAEADERVWYLTSRDGTKPPPEFTVISSRQVVEGVEFRVIGDQHPGEHAHPATPSLEDGYMWLMGQTRQQVEHPR